MLLLFWFKKQMQAGANWDSVIGISIGILLVGSVLLIGGLIISRMRQARRFRRAHMRPRRGSSRSK